MKFAEHLRESIVPEWNDKYVDYKLGKKKIKQFQKLSRISGVGSLDEKLIREFIDEWIVRDQLKKCDEFYQWQMTKCEEKFNKLQRQIDLFILEKDKRQLNISREENSSVDLTRAPESYGSIFSPLALNVGFRERLWIYAKQWLLANDLYPTLPVHFKRSDSLLAEERQKRSGSRGQETFQRGASHLTLTQIKQQLSDAILEFYLYLQLLKNFRDLNVNGFRKIVKKFDKNCNQHQLKAFMAFAKSNSLMFIQYDEYLKLIKINLENKDAVNVNLFLKDWDEDSLRKDPLSFWENATVKWYTMTLTTSSKDKKDKLEKLRTLSLKYSLNEQTIHKTNSSISQIFLGSLQLGVSVALGLIMVTMISSSNSKLVKSNLLPIWSSFYFLALMGLFYMLDCFIWFKVKINYRFIMFGEIHSGSGPILFKNDFAMTSIPLQYFQSTTFLFFCSVFAYISFSSGGLNPWLWVWLIVGFSLFLWGWNNFGIWPFWTETWDSRKWMMISIMRLCFSGFYPVQFGDFFLGDIVCSLTYSMSQFATLGCLTLNHSKEDKCRYENLIWIGILSCLPSYWRFMQCIRRYLDSYDWFPHLLNAGKYIMSILFNASLYFYKSWPDSKKFKVLLLFFGLLNSFYTCLWDLVMDWSLLQSHSTNLFLRNDLYLCGKRNWKTGRYQAKRKCVYYFVMIFDVIIRFEWIFYIISDSTDYVRHPLVALTMAILEIVRRFIWVILRVENEHVANVHLFRVTEDNWKLPFPTAERLESLTETAYPPAAENMDNIAMLTLRKSHRESQPAVAHPQLKRKASVLEVIPWAHAADFQRPIENSNMPSDKNLSDSDSDSESVT